MQVVLLPEHQQVAEVLHDGGVTGSTRALRAGGGGLHSEGAQVAGQQLLLVGEHQENQRRVQATHVLLRRATEKIGDFFSVCNIVMALKSGFIQSRKLIFMIKSLIFWIVKW